ASAFSIWVRIGNLRLVCWPVLVGGETSGLSPISQICYFSMHHQLFAWAKMDSDALLTFLTVHRRGGISSAAKALHRSQPAISRRFAAEDPEVELSLRTATSAEVSDLIRRGEATIGLRYDRDRSRDLDCELLFAERLQVVCAPDHPRAGRRVAKLAELRGERWIAFPVVPGRREITASPVFALVQTLGLGQVDWTP